MLCLATHGAALNMNKIAINLLIYINKFPSLIGPSDDLPSADNVTGEIYRQVLFSVPRTTNNNNNIMQLCALKEKEESSSVVTLLGHSTCNWNQLSSANDATMLQPEALVLLARLIAANIFSTTG